MFSELAEIAKLLKDILTELRGIHTIMKNKDFACIHALKEKKK